MTRRLPVRDPSRPPPRRVPRGVACLRYVFLVAPALAFAGAVGEHDALAPAGAQAAHIDHLWQALLWGCSAVFLTVMVVLVLSLRRGRPVPDAEDLPEPARRRAIGFITLGVGVTIAVLAWFMVENLRAEHRLRRVETPDDPRTLTLLVTGRQWWWEIRYDFPQPSDTVVTANELHIPVGRPVHLRLASADVIHSFWAPSLHGKRDLVPGRENHLWLQADRPGLFEGQCAEFCGHQHAKMRLLVVAQPEDEFQRWLTGQRLPAPEPRADAERRGREIFLQGSCVLCHSIRGTPAGGRAGPDLTHLAGRRDLAAGAIPNTRGHLAGWIVDPQGIKPGCHMPAQSLRAEDLEPLLDYLGSLR